MDDATTHAERLARIRDRIAVAVARRGPGPEPLLVAVSKRKPDAAVRALARAGVRDFGENYAQALAARRRSLADLPELRWHFIGGLQTNKVKIAVGSALIHTVDRARLVDAIDRRAASLGIVQEVLVEVSFSGDGDSDGDGRAGVTPSGLAGLLDHLAGREHLVCRGLMTIPPVDAPGGPRRCFAALRELAGAHAGAGRPGVALEQLSMGMSGDLEDAILEGATIVRVGTALFGPRET